MQELNRIISIIKPTTKMLEWLNQQPGQTEILTLNDIHSDCTAILIPPFDNPEDAHQYIDDMSSEIFENELTSWGVNEKDWPKSRTIEMFEAWFDVEFHSMVFDASDYPEDEVEIEEDEY